MAFTLVFYALAAAGLLVSLIADKRRTGAALKKAWKAFSGILPEFLVVLIATGLILAFLSPQTISRIRGGESGWIGVLSASLIGSITLIPGFVAFPMAALLLQQRAGIMRVLSANVRRLSDFCRVILGRADFQSGWDVASDDIICFR